MGSWLATVGTLCECYQEQSPTTITGRMEMGKSPERYNNILYLFFTKVYIFIHDVIPI